MIAPPEGIGHFFHDLRRMCGWQPPTLLKSHLIVFISTVCPIILGALIYSDVLGLLEPRRSLGALGVQFPRWSVYVGLALSSLSIVCIPLGACHYLLFQPAYASQYRQKQAAKPESSPTGTFQAMAEPRLDLCSKLYHGFRSTLAFRRNELANRRACPVSHHHPYQMQQQPVPPYALSPCCAGGACGQQGCFPAGCGGMLMAGGYASAGCIGCACQTRPGLSAGELLRIDPSAAYRSARCECNLLLGEYNGSFVQEF